MKQEELLEDLVVKALNRHYPKLDSVFMSQLNSALSENAIGQDQYHRLMVAHLDEQSRAHAAIKAILNEQYRDGLTGAWNRRAYDCLMDKPDDLYSLIIIDIDSFKNVNDTYGHSVGDKALRYVAGMVTGAVRRTDIVARYGGEELAVYLPQTSKTTARLIAEKIRLRVASDLNIGKYIPEVKCLTVSIGVSDSAEADSASAVFALADKRLYEAKHTGKNRVIY